MRWCGVRVEVFSIGFGRELFGWNAKSGTRWKICAIPLGGYIKMFGEHTLESNDDGEVRELTEQELKYFGYSAEHYVKLARRHQGLSD